jgi:uncharacterized phiE125 gp8 family phage protein
MLTELAPVPAGDLPIAALRDHLRLGTGFADDSVQDGILETVLRAALAAVEGRTGRALLVRGFALEATASGGGVALPVGPAMVTMVEVVAGDGSRMDVTARVSVTGGSRPVVSSLPGYGTVVIGFAAGFGAWDSVPPDLRQAVLMLAAAWYEDRDAAGAAFPAAVAAILAPWRVLRLGAAR